MGRVVSGGMVEFEGEVFSDCPALSLYCLCFWSLHIDPLHRDSHKAEPTSRGL